MPWLKILAILVGAPIIVVLGFLFGYTMCGVVVGLTDRFERSGGTLTRGLDAWDGWVQRVCSGRRKGER